MPVLGFLLPSQKQSLQKALYKDDCPHFRQRVLILLLMNDGKTYQQIANFIGCSLRTVAYWGVHGDPEYLETLRDRREQGNYRKATDLYIKILLDTLEKDPKDLGYDFGRWTCKRLATYLAENTGIALSSSQIRRILEKKGLSYIWAKYDLSDKQNPEKRKEFKERIKKYFELIKQTPDSVQIWFWDESGFSTRVIRRKCWGKKGQRKKLSGKRSQGRIGVMGGLRYNDKKRVCFFVEKGNGDTFFEQLKALHDWVKQEWVEKGNLLSDFLRKGPKIVIVLDNASYHKRRDISDKIEKELPNIILEFLPPYSPDYNIIELVWHSVKEYIAHKLFTSKEELQKVINNLLNEGGLTIVWGRKLKNKGNIDIAS